MLKVNVPHPSVVFGREVIGELIRKFFIYFLLVQAELVLFDAAAHQLETHIKILGTISAHIAGEDSLGGCAVGIDWGGRLWVSHFDEGCVDGNNLLDVE